MRSRVIPAGKIFIRGEKRGGEADVAQGAQAIMQAMSACAPVCDIRGEAGTHAGGMLERVRKVMASLTGHDMNTVHIQDLLAVDYIYSAQGAGRHRRRVFNGERRGHCGDGESRSFTDAGHRQ